MLAPYTIGFSGLQTVPRDKQRKSSNIYTIRIDLHILYIIFYYLNYVDIFNAFISLRGSEIWSR